MDIPGGLAAAGHAISIARALRDLDHAMGKVALKEQVIDLMDRLQDVRSSLQDARDALLLKDQEIEGLRELAVSRESTVMIHGFRYRADPDDIFNPVGFPFCPRCETMLEKLVGLVDNLGKQGSICPECRREYGRDARMFLWPDQRQ